jgi:hypothetical protein
MKNYFYLLFVLPLFCFSQKIAKNFKSDILIQTSFLRGNILRHSNKIDQLITGHPEGIFITFLKKSSRKKEWQKLYNNPDYGVYFLAQDFKNQYLGNNFSAGFLYQFYFLKRNLQLQTASGLAYNTNPYNKVNNSRNNAFGSKFMANITIGLQYKKEKIIDNFGVQTGFLVTHYSNGRFQSPNSGINTYNLNLGVNYVFSNTEKTATDTIKVSNKFNEKIKYSAYFRTGFNESYIINSGKFPFYHISLYADKRINKKSAIQFGTELFLTTSFKEFIKYQSVAYPENNLNSDTDFKRVSLFVGHELFLGSVSLETQVGVYVYQPYKFDIPVYNRLGIKYYLNSKLFTGISFKTHGFFAEALELGIGYRL